jgi:multiple sugar transport system ATP-binding protein
VQEVEAMASITLEDISKVYPDGTSAVSSLNLDVRDGELMVLVGPSGCGKSTALLMVAGLVEATNGTVRIGERVVSRVPPKDRDVAMVFQNYALYPHMSVYNNMAFGLKLRGMSRGDIDRRVREIASVLGLEDFLSRKPSSLSGGQRQRVAMGRAIVREPQVFLMDEPLSNLDAKLRVRVRAEISRIQSAVQITTIYVTHDQTEAMTMGDRVAVMRSGELQQVDTPQSLYNRPANMFVAGFMGSPPMNLFEAQVEVTESGMALGLGNVEIAIDDEALADRPRLRQYAGRAVTVGIRPEDLKDSAAEAFPSDRRFPAVIELKESLGSDVLVYFTPAWASQKIELELDESDEHGGEFRALQMRTKRAEATLVARLSPETRVQEGDKIELAIESRKLHFFDPSSGTAIWE